MVAQFAIVPKFLLDASPVAVKVYLALSLRADHDTGVCWPSRSLIAQDIGMSVPTVKRGIKELVACGAISVQSRVDDAGDWTSNLYTLPFAISRRGGVTREPTRSVTREPRVGSPVVRNPDPSEPEPSEETFIPKVPKRKKGEPMRGYIARISK